VVNRVNRQSQLLQSCAPPPDGVCGHWAAKEPAQANFKSHGLATGGKTLYVADRTNARMQRFNLDGSYIGEWNHPAGLLRSGSRAARCGSQS